MSEARANVPEEKCACAHFVRIRTPEHVPRSTRDSEVCPAVLSEFTSLVTVRTNLARAHWYESKIICFLHKTPYTAV